MSQIISSQSRFNIPGMPSKNRNPKNPKGQFSELRFWAVTAAAEFRTNEVIEL